MSNEMQIFKGARPAGAFATLNPQAESLAEGIGSSFGVLHLKGKVWSLQHKGVRYEFNREDDGTPLPYLDVIFLRVMPQMSKTYYPPNSYEEGSSASPLCSSVDSVRPDTGVKQPQASACAVCPRNVWYNNPDGRRTRDCADNKRVALLIHPKLTKRAMGVELQEPVFLRIPPASLTGLAQLGEQMERQGWHYSSYVTRLGFERDVATPKLTYQAVEALTEEEGPMIMRLREDPIAYRITGERNITSGQVTPATAVPPVPEFVTTSKPVMMVLERDPPNYVVKPAPVIDATPVKAAPSPVQELAEVEDSNPDLDAKIAALLKTS